MEYPVLEKRTPGVYLTFVLAFIVITISVAHSYLLRWVNDDAFISFRYAKNFVEGLGLVYNAGERVEGYTNFLWTIIIAGGMKAGIDAVAFSMVLGIAFHALTILLFIFMSWIVQRQHGVTIIIPVTSLALCVHHDFNVYATSGLETSFFTFITSLCFFSIVFGKSHKRVIISGILFSLLIMTHPDGVLFLAAAIIFFLLTEKNRWQKVLLLILPVIILYLPYWLWRYSYYGYPFPNTFYAKSAYLTYYSQGLKYVLLYWKTYYILALLPILFFIGILKEKSSSVISASLLSKESSASSAYHPMLLALLFCFFWMFYVIRIGGDFMFARFLIPITPFLFFMCEFLLIRYLRPTFSRVLIAILLLTTFIRFDQYTTSPERDGITDEWKFYPLESLEKSRKIGRTLHKYFDHLPVKIAYGGMMAQVVYYAEPSVAIECFGLTDTTIAHQTLALRGRPGHEKTVPIEYLVKRRVNFLLWKDQAPFYLRPVTQISFDGNQYFIFLYENTIMDKLSDYPEVKFVRAPEYADSYIASMDTLRSQHIMTDYAFLKSYYFNPNHDRAREEAFLSHLKKASFASSK